MLEKCLLDILGLNWNQRLGHKKTKINICHHMLTSSIRLQNRSFHVVERTRTSSKCQKIKNARAKRAKLLFFIVKYANLWRSCCRRRRGCLSSLLSLISDFFTWYCFSYTCWQKTNDWQAGSFLSNVFAIWALSCRDFRARNPKE